MNNKLFVFGLISIVAGILAIVADTELVRIVALVTVVGSSVLMGIALGSKPFKKQ